MWSVIFAFLASAMVALLVAGLIRPAWFANTNSGEIPKRSEFAIGSIFLLVVFAGLSAFLSPSAKTDLESDTKRSSTYSKKAMQTDPWIKPETLVEFPKGEIACLSLDDLRDTFLLGSSGRGTKLSAYFQDQDGSGPRCLMLPPKTTFKVIDVERKNGSVPDALLLEIVGQDVKASDEGAYVMVLDRSMAKIL